jgi:hypothetical protein
MHKSRSVLLTVMVVFLYSYATAHAVLLSFVPASQSVVIGSAVSIDLVISGLGDHMPPSLSTFDLDVSFDPAIVTLATTDTDGDGVIDSVVLDPTGQLDVLGLGGNPMSAQLVGPGTLNLFDLSLDDPVDLDTLQAGTFPLATITFGSIGLGTSSLDVLINALGDAEGNPLPADVSAGSITVTQSSVQTPEPSTIFLLGACLLGLLGCCWRQRRSVASCPTE